LQTKPRSVTTLLAFERWINGLKDAKGKGQVEYRINKVRRGLIGEYDKVGDGVLELILDNTGPGYRVYCVDDGESTLLLTGGIKRTQAEDILLAKKLWKEVKESN
jgi:putative addiction module killer protein